MWHTRYAADLLHPLGFMSKLWHTLQLGSSPVEAMYVEHSALEGVPDCWRREKVWPVTGMEAGARVW